MFKKGDIVKVKSLDEVLDIEDAEYISDVQHPKITLRMMDCFDKEGVVVDVTERGYIKVYVDEGSWYYNPNWLDKVSGVLTIKDFEKAVMDLGFSVSIESTGVVVKDKDGLIAMKVPSKCRGCVDTCWIGFTDTHDWDTRYKLLELGAKLASTPVDKRNVEAKYYLSLPEPLKHNASYLNLKLDTDTYVFSVKEETVGFQTKFTQEEIDDFPNQEFIQTLIKEEV